MLVDCLALLPMAALLPLLQSVGNKCLVMNQFQRSIPLEIRALDPAVLFLGA